MLAADIPGKQFGNAGIHCWNLYKSHLLYFENEPEENFVASMIYNLTRLRGMYSICCRMRCNSKYRIHIQLFPMAHLRQRFIYVGNYQTMLIYMWVILFICTDPGMSLNCAPIRVCRKSTSRPGYVVKVRPDPGYVVKQCPRIVMNKIFDWH